MTESITPVNPQPTPVADQSVQQTTPDTLTFEDSVVEKIVAITCQEVDGILEMKGGLISAIHEGLGGTDLTKGIDVTIEDDQRCYVDVAIVMEYGKSAQKIFNSLRGVIGENVTAMTGLVVDAINVRIVNVMTREEYQRLQAKREEKLETSSVG